MITGCQFAVKKSGRSVIGIAAILLFLGSLISLSYSIMSGRLRKARVRSTDIGDIDIGVDAIESIALNAAKAAQSGIRTAKARVLPFKGGRISVRLSAMVYPDVELAPMMSRVQERVKKDVERYTGIEVGNVEIKINRVEAINVRVER